MYLFYDINLHRFQNNEKHARILTQNIRKS
jgi:hypothetical protein